MKNVTLSLSIFVIAILFATKTNAQSSPSSELEIKPRQFFLKAVYLDWSNTITWAAGSDGSFENRGGGITFITQKNWMFSGRITSGAGEPSQKPAGNISFQSATGNSGVGGIGSSMFDFNIGLGSYVGSGGSGSSRKKEDCSGLCKEFKMISLLAGKMFNHPYSKPRMSIQGGLTLMNIDEPVDFVLVPGQGYTYTQNESWKIGPTARIGIEFPFSRYVGFSINLEGAIAKDERLFGLGAGIMVGLLREKKK